MLCKVIELLFVFVKYMGGDIKYTVNITGVNDLLRGALVHYLPAIH